MSDNQSNEQTSTLPEGPGFISTHESLRQGSRLEAQFRSVNGNPRLVLYIGGVTLLLTAEQWQAIAATVDAVLVVPQAVTV